jgi:hypothetical protein
MAGRDQVSEFAAQRDTRNSRVTHTPPDCICSFDEVSVVPFANRTFGLRSSIDWIFIVFGAVARVVTRC